TLRMPGESILRYLLTINNPSTKPSDFDLPCFIWSKLNKIRCDTGRSASTLDQWGWKDSPCCGANMQTIKHIVQDYSPGMLAGIISSVVVAIVGAVSSFIAYQKKKLCFKASAPSGKVINKELLKLHIQLCSPAKVAYICALVQLR
uniref:Uncharacterized protein n=1 Tax=Naja naja TaxID=35670 RepID=A0A8C7E2I6_NAJNA